MLVRNTLVSPAQPRLVSLLWTLTAVFLPLIVSAAPRSPLFKDDNLEINIAHEKKGGDAEVHILIETKKITESSVFSLAEPPRIVVDLRGPVIRRNRDLEVKDGLVSKIRLGAHSDKTRFVIDLKRMPIPPYRWSASKDSAVLKINVSPNEADVALPDLKQESLPVPSPTSAKRVAKEPSSDASKVDELTIDELIKSEPPRSVPTPIVESKATTSAGAQKEEQQSEASVVEEKPIQDGAQEIVSLEFGYSGDKEIKPTLKLKMAKRSEFQFTKMSDRGYKLSVAQCQLRRAALKLPQFPPHDFLGFNMVQLKERNKNVEVTILIDEAIRLTAAPHGDEIWISKTAAPRPITKSHPR